MIRVLVVDDSAFMRRAICAMLENDPRVIVCGTARDGHEAVGKALALEPDVVTMDVEMPKMGGLEAVREILAQCANAGKPAIPIVMLSSLTRQGAETTFRALELGAVDFIAKPDVAYADMPRVARDLLQKIIGCHRELVRSTGIERRPKPGRRVRAAAKRIDAGTFECLAVGASTGGPAALSRIIPYLPAAFPLPIVVVQHMPPGFTKPLADRLNRQSTLRVCEGEAGMVLEPGLAIVAPAGKHLRLRRDGEIVEAALDTREGDALHVPSVDFMVASAAQTFGASTLAVILTGMGQDGLEGLRRVKAAGGYALAQDAASCVVYGMPRAAVEAGLADRVVSLDDLPAALCDLTKVGGR